MDVLPSSTHAVTVDVDSGPVESLVHNPRLDGVRGLAIALVLIGHIETAWLVGASVAGVALFFVLSGYLITALLLTERERTGGNRLSSFYVRRALRLFPALFSFLAVYGVWALLWTRGPGLAGRLRSVWTGALYVTNWAFMIGRGGSMELVHLWSLAMEEQFYLLWPCTLLVLLRARNRQSVIRWLIALIVGFALLRSLAYRAPLARSVNPYFSPLTWADTLLVGCLLGVLFTWRRIPQRRVSGPVVAVAIVVGAAVVATNDTRPLVNGGVTLLAACNAVIVLGAIQPRSALTRMLNWRWLRWLGRISYGVYLWHLPIVHAVEATWPHAPAAFVALLAIPATLGAASLSYRYVEQPFLRRKTRWQTAARPAVSGSVMSGAASGGPSTAGATAL